MWLWHLHSCQQPQALPRAMTLMPSKPRPNAIRQIAPIPRIAIRASNVPAIRDAFVFKEQGFLNIQNPPPSWWVYFFQLPDPEALVREARFPAHPGFQKSRDEKAGILLF